MAQGKQDKRVVYTVSGSAVSFISDSLATCKLCLTDYHAYEMYTLWGCHCSYCTNCVLQYLTVMINEGLVLSITCPDGACKKQGTIKDAEIETLVDISTYGKYLRFKFLREVEADPRKAFCPTAGCEKVCLIEGDRSRKKSPVLVHCVECRLDFCSRCKCAWHQDKTCDEAIASTVDRTNIVIPFHSPEDADIKRCPGCLIPIERNHGCAQMMCKKCKHVFCWYCLKSLDKDFMLRHYDKGPCKNKLGHSQASLFWHRTQVIGLFTGFGILLLVASPILFLAAPCFLCAVAGKCDKCKACKCDDESDLDDWSSS